MAKGVKYDTHHHVEPFDFVPTHDTDTRIIKGMCPLRGDEAGWWGRRIQEFIYRRRRQLIVHSVVYYKLDDNVVDDYTWQRWANELAAVQTAYPDYVNIGFNDALFSGFDGSTGYHLVLPEFFDLARTLLEANRIKRGLD